MKKLLIATLFISIGLWSCKDSGGGGDEEPVVKTLKDSVGFSSMVKPLFNIHCNTAGCHTSGAGFVNLSKNNTSMDADKQHDMMKSITTVVNATENKMPKGKPRLSARNIQIIQYWIEKGYPE